MVELQEKQIWISPETHQKIKILAAKKGMTMKEYLAQKVGEDDKRNN